MEKSSSKNNLTNNFVWSLAEKAGRYGITLLTSIVLARILGPEEFGVTAIVTVFITLANVFVQNGFGFAIIQKKDATDKDFTFVLAFNVVVSIGIYLLIFIIAPFAERYYAMDDLSAIIRIMSLSVIVAAVGNIQQAYVSRRLEFKKLFISTFSAVMISGTVGVVMALIGYGVWALVVQHLLYSVVSTITLAFSSGMKMKKGVSFSECKDTLSLGWKFLLTSLITTIGNEIRTLVIGKLYSPADLAYVNKGQRLTNAPMTVVQSSITAVMYPVLAKHQDRTESIRDIVRRFAQVSSFVIFPVLFGMAAVADILVPLLLTDKWIESVQYVVIYCFVWLLNPIQMAHIQAIKAVGKGNILVVLEIVKSIVSLGILAISVLMFDSIQAIVIGLLIAEIICTLLTCPVGRKLFGYSLKMQISDIILPMLLSVIMFVLVKMVGLLNINTFLILILQILAGVISYLGISCILKPKGYDITIQVAKRYLSSLGARNV